MAAFMSACLLLTNALPANVTGYAEETTEMPVELSEPVPEEPVASPAPEEAAPPADIPAETAAPEPEILPQPEPEPVPEEAAAVPAETAEPADTYVEPAGQELPPEEPQVQEETAPADPVIEDDIPPAPVQVDKITWNREGEEGSITYAEIEGGYLQDNYHFEIMELTGEDFQVLQADASSCNQLSEASMLTAFFIMLEDGDMASPDREKRHVSVRMPKTPCSKTHHVFHLEDGKEWEEIEAEDKPDGEGSLIAFEYDGPKDNSEVYALFDITAESGQAESASEPETAAPETGSIPEGSEKDSEAPEGETQETEEALTEEAGSEAETEEAQTEFLTEGGSEYPAEETETEALSEEAETEYVTEEAMTEALEEDGETDPAGMGAASVQFDFGLNSAEKSYEYEDDYAQIRAQITEPGVIPERAVFVCERVDEKSERYVQLRAKTAEYLGLTDDQVDILPYDIYFMVGEMKVEPSYGCVNVSFSLKTPIEIQEDGEAPVIHIKDNSDIELLSSDVSTDGTVEEYEVALASFSPVVLATPNPSSAPLKSVKITDDSGAVYYISKTSNIDNNGNTTTYYGNNQNVTDKIDLTGSVTTDVVIKYRTESTSYDWLYIKDKNGNILKKDADGKQVGDSNGKIGGGGSNNTTPSNTVTYRFEQDQLQFVWRTDGSVVSYGYYAVITPTIPTSDIPDYHLEEQEDGTYALVFDKGGDIDAFMLRPEVKQALAQYKNKITEVRLHKGTTSIKNSAFKGLSSLTKVTVPRNCQLHTIGKNVFANCENLTSFTIPSTVTTFGDTPFEGCRSLQELKFAEGSQVEKLPNGMLKGLTALKKVTLPDTLKAIPANLFDGDTALYDVNMPSACTSIGAGAYRGTAITEVPDLSNITSIGTRAFSGCKKITEVSIPSNVTSIGTAAFENCTAVTDFTFEDGTSFPTLPASLFSGMTKLKNVKLPDDLTRIPNYCFQNCSSLEHVDIPDTVTRMGDYAFTGCSKLKDFEIPSQVTTLGPYLFNGCTSLKDMSIPATVTSVGSGLFYGCSGLIRARFEYGSPITTLPNAMFQGCTRLEDVKLPDGVTAIPASYFRECTSLKNVTLPENLTSIGEYAFYNCYNLENVPLTNKLKTIGQYAFYNCDKLTDLVIPKSVTTIGSGVWQNCDGIKSVTFESGSTLTSLPTSLFSGCKNLVTAVLPTNLRSIPSSLFYDCQKLKNVTIPTNVTTIGDSAFYNCYALKQIAIPSNVTAIYSSAFRNSGLTSVTLPARLGSVGSSAFQGTKLTSVEIPNQVTSVGNSSFADITTLQLVVFTPGGKNCSIGEYAFSGDYALKDLSLKEGITSIGRYAFSNNRRLEEITIPSTVTSIGSYAFQNEQNVKKLEFLPAANNSKLKIDTNNNGSTFARLGSVEEVIIDRDVTSDYTARTNFLNINPEASYTIGSHVNTLDNMFVSQFKENTKVTFIGENDFSVSTRISNTSEDAKWSELKGDFYVDPDGVVYKLNKTNKTASVFYIPEGLTEYTIPEKVTSVAGVEYTVRSIDSYAVRSASDLTALTVEAPQNITIPQFAFSKCPTLQTINGKDELYPEEWEEVSLLCDFPVHSDSEPQQVLTISSSTNVGEPGPDGEQPRFSFGISISGQEKMDEDGLTYVYPTGMSARMDFAVSNESNVDMSDRVIRVYFAFDGDNYTMGNYPPGDYTLVNTATGSRYPFKVRATEAKGVYYYDLTGFKPGDTLAFNNQFSYLSPKSGGGTMRVWAETISAEQAAQLEGKVSQPGDYMLADWYTTPTPYNLTKTINGNPQFQFISNEADANDDNIYVKNMTYAISLKSGGATGTSYAKDYIKYVEFEDDLKLNENMLWRPAIIEAIRNGDFYVNTSGYVYAKVGTRWEEVFHITYGDANLLMSLTPVIVTDENGNDAVRIKWAYRNTYWSNEVTAPTADMPATNYTVTIGSHAVQVNRESDLWEMLREGAEFSDAESEQMRKVVNAVHETTHYCFSEDKENDAQAPQRLVYMTTGFSMSKTSTGYTTFGRDHGFNISLTNSGLAHKDDIDLVEDALVTHYYIPGANIESMLRNTKWGPFVSIDVSSATLCRLPEKTVKDVYGNDVDITTATQSGVDPIPYNGRAGTDNSVRTASARLSFHWNEDHSAIALEVKQDDGSLISSYEIGSGKDYATIQEALDAIGYLVTSNAAYKVKWDLGDNYTLYKASQDGVQVSDVSELTTEQQRAYEYRLRSGRTDTFNIPAKTKDTTMWINTDTPGQYGSSSVYSSNAAYARDNTGRQVGVANWTGYVYRELSLSKSASANGKTWSSNIEIPDDTVLDYTLSFTNSGDTHDVLPLTDKMSGTQVLLVPVRGNRNALYYAPGSEEGVALSEAGLDEYMDGGINYYVLDVSGTYKGITIDGRLSDSIQVTKTAGNATTLMTWYYQDVTGASANTSSVTRSITYKALADSSRLGGQSQDESGSSVTRTALYNESWLGGHQTHRLYASLNGGTQAMQFSKSIVEDPEASRENLIGHSLVQDGDTVKYKIIIRNTGENELTLNGRSIHDNLPSTSGIFPWSKENVLDISYVTENLGSSVENTSPDYWSISSIQPGTGANTASQGLYYIYWNQGFNIHFDPKGEVWIYVTVKFPSSDDTDDLGNYTNTWDDYIARNSGGVLTNYFYIGDRESHVTHELTDLVEGRLQKGVLDTGLSRNGYFQSESTRHYYQNGGNTDNGSVQSVAYYTVIYNSGNVRLYLDPMRDQLPKGFKFRGLINAIPKTAQTSDGFSTTNSSNYNTLGSYASKTSIPYTENRASDSNFMMVASVSDTKRPVTYKNASVSAATANDVDGHQQVTFTFGRNTNNDSYLRYDSSLQKYYLNPGEAVRFGYMCYVEGYARTENVAANEIAMPVYDKYGLGVVMSDEEQVRITPATYRDIAVNDGTCTQETTEVEANGRRHERSSWVKNTTEWWSSEVSLERLAPVPGLLKTVAGETVVSATTQISPNSIYGPTYSSGNIAGNPYTGTVARTSVVNWLIRAYNEGGVGSNSMEDYWIVDTVDAPYRFTGNYYYDYYSLNGTKMTSSPVPLFSLGGRVEGDTSVKISTGQGSNTLSLSSTITVNGPAVDVDGGRAQVQLLRDANGNETLKIRIKDSMHRIPPNSYLALYAHTQYVSTDAVLSKQFYNHAQLEPGVEFDPAMVSQGKVLYQEEEGEFIPYAIESGASVTMTAGYSSAARKKITQMDNTSNVGWSDKTKNSIMLPEKFTKFFYDLFVDLPKDEPTSRLVLIDSLPQPGDHSPFVDRDTRDSQFIVHMLSEDLGFTVWSSPNLGTGTKIQLPYDAYTLEVSTRTEFDTPDWDGNGEGWTMVTLSDGLSADETALIEQARSFRIIIEDTDILERPEDAIMGKNYQVQVRLNAEILNPEEADPGAIAWNSFGYRYTVPIGATGMFTSLNAEPLKVGVQIPSVPYVIKDQKTPHNHYRTIETDSSYRFLIYSGSAVAALNDISQMDLAQIAQVLQDNSRDVMITGIDIGAGASTGRTGYFDAERKWVYDAGEGDFVPTENHWVWASGGKYTILELPWDENGFTFQDVQHSRVNNYTFTQNSSNNVVLRVTNVYGRKGKLSLTKTVNGPSADQERKFTFTIHLQDGRYPVYGTYEYIGTNIRNGSLTFNDQGNAVIQLKHGQSIELQDIPDGYTYSITEADDVLYTSTPTNAQGTIVWNTTQAASFLNTRKDTTLTVKKIVTGNMGSRVKLFDFEIYVVDEGRELTGDYTMVTKHSDDSTTTSTITFTEGAANIQLSHGDEATVQGLPVGARYEVDENINSSRTYTVTSTGEAGTLTEEGNVSEWTNTRNMVVPTLIADGYNGLYLILIAAMIFLFAYLLRKRKNSIAR